MRVQNQILSNLREEHLNEYTNWKHIGGPKRKFMDEKYMKNIINKLIPMLHQYGIEMSLYPSKDAPGYQNYMGYAPDKSRIDFKFISSFKPTSGDREGKYDMTVKIYHEGDEEIAGVITLGSRDEVEEAFEIITMTLENMGIIGDKPKGEETDKPKSKEDLELDDLAKFKSGLSEQEILEIEVD